MSSWPPSPKCWSLPALPDERVVALAAVGDVVAIAAEEAVVARAEVGVDVHPAAVDAVDRDGVRAAAARDVEHAALAAGRRRRPVADPLTEVDVDLVEALVELRVVVAIVELQHEVREERRIATVRAQRHVLGCLRDRRGVRVGVEALRSRGADLHGAAVEDARVVRPAGVVDVVEPRGVVPVAADHGQRVAGRAVDPDRRGGARRPQEHRCRGETDEDRGAVEDAQRRSTLLLILGQVRPSPRARAARGRRCSGGTGSPGPRPGAARASASVSPSSASPASSLPRLAPAQ